MSLARIYIKKSSIILTDYKDLVSFDWEGRWFYAYIKNKGYRRGLNGKIILKKLNYVKELKDSEKNRFENALYSWIFKQTKNIKYSDICKEEEELDEKIAFERIKRGPAFLKKDAHKFNKIYSDIGILPPDQYLSFVVQCTEGCHYNKCTFCNFYKNKQFRIKDKKEIEKDIKKAFSLLGDGISLRKTIFLSDANALLIPSSKLQSILETIIKFSFPFPKNFYSFLDIFTGIKKEKTFFEILKKYNFKRVYIGLETGDKKLLDFLEKPQEPEEFVYLVHNLKKYEINVGIIVMVGIGGDRFSKEHIKNTLKILQKLPLDKNDILYVSDFVEFPETVYYEKAKKYGIKPIKDYEKDIQRNFFFQLFKERKERPKIARYNILEFVY